MKPPTFNQIVFLVAVLAVGGGVATGKLAPETLLALLTWFLKSPLPAGEPKGEP